MTKEEDVLAALDKPRAIYALQQRLDGKFLSRHNVNPREGRHRPVGSRIPGHQSDVGHPGFGGEAIAMASKQGLQSAVRATVVAAIWFTYLQCSKRVRATYGVPAAAPIVTPRTLLDRAQFWFPENDYSSYWPAPASLVALLSACALEFSRKSWWLEFLSDYRGHRTHRAPLETYEPHRQSHISDSAHPGRRKLHRVPALSPSVAPPTSLDQGGLGLVGLSCAGHLQLPCLDDRTAQAMGQEEGAV